MAVQKVIDIVVNINQAVKDVKNLFSTMVDEQTEANKQQEKLNDNVADLGTTAKKTEKGLQSISKGFKGVGLAIKAAGIGLVISAFSALKELFLSNERVAKGFATAMEVISVVFNEVTNAVFDAYDNIKQATNGFDAFGKVISGVINVGLGALKFNFFNIKLAVQQAQLAWEQSIFGGKDANTIKELNKDILETKNNINEVIVKTVEAGKDVVNNFGEAINEVGQLGSAISDNIQKIDIAESSARAKRNIELEKTAKIAEATSRILIEKYDRQAEKLRQIRDNEFKSIKERKNANDELGAVLDKQEKAMIAQANAVLASANAQYAKTRSTEDLVAVLDAQAEIEGVLATITGFRSEQDANKNALLKEEIELQQSKEESLNNVAIAEANALSELEQNELKKIELKRDAFELEKEIELERLEFNIQKFASGTQARVDAENELRERLQEFNQTDLELKKEQLDAELALEKQNADAKKKILELEAKAKVDNLDVTAQVAKEASSLLGASTTEGKIAGVASATISTYLGAQKAYTSQLVPGDPSSVARASISAGLAIVSGLKNVSEILKVKTPNGGGGGSVPSASTPTAPAFNLVGGTGTNQIQDTLQQDATPIQAVVVSSAVTSAQEMDRNAIDGATLG